MLTFCFCFSNLKRDGFFCFVLLKNGKKKNKYLFINIKKVYNDDETFALAISRFGVCFLVLLSKIVYLLNVSLIVYKSITIFLKMLAKNWLYSESK